MIEITVRLENGVNSQYEIIQISKTELKQIACNKAKELYLEGYWNRITADDEFKVTLNM